MKFFKRSLSVLLAALMAFSQPIATLADTDTVEPTYVGGERLEDVPEGNYVYLGNTAITLREGNGSFCVPIYRTDTTDEAWVKIHTIDLTSVYGRDYRVEGKNKTEHAGKKNIFQLLAEDNDNDSVEVKNYEFDIDVASPSEAKNGNATDSSKEASAENGSSKSETAQNGDTKTDSTNSSDDKTGSTDSSDSNIDATYLDGDVAIGDDDLAAGMDDDLAVGMDDDFAAGGEADNYAADDAQAADNSKIDINDENLKITNLKHISSDRVANEEIAAAYNETADALNSADTATDKDKEDEDEVAEAEVIDQKAVVDTYTDTSTEDDGISELAKLKYEQTGVPSREGTPTGTVNANLTDQIFGAIAPEYMGLISYSCEQTIYFEPGEDEAEFQFQLYDNPNSDGSRMFSVIISETSDNIEIYKGASMSVLIEDDEETSHSKLSFASESFDGTNNSTELKIVRSDLLQTMATAVLTAENSDTGEVETLGELVFTPYEKEKTIKLNITHDSILRLTDLTAADEGDIMSAIVTGTDNISGEYGIAVASETEDEASESNELTALSDEAMLLSDDGAVALADSSDQKEFSISVNSKNLTARYKNGDLKATLYDTSYNPELAVGDYFFAVDEKNGGMFSYDPLHLEGDQPGWGGEAAEAFVFESDEAKTNKDFRKSHGWAHYFTRGKASLEGRVRIDPVLDKASPINALYYQYIAPEMEMGETWALVWSDEWTSFRIGPKSFYTNGQPKDQVDKYVHHIKGKFGKGVQSLLSVKITNENSLLYPMASAEDNCAFVCKTMFNIWGMAAMYKKYEVSVEDADAVSYKSADGKTTTVPYQIKIKCGAQNPNNTNVRDLYVNPVAENSNIVFTVQANNINGATDTFGKLKGYKITIGNGNTKTDQTVNYPEDFIAFIKDSKRVSTDAIDYGTEAIEKEVAKINNDISIVPVDIYFVDWMNSVSQEFVVPSDNMNNTAHYQMLRFKPVIDYIDVNVQITEPSISGKGLTGNVAHFKDSELKAGTTKTYHAGDLLDLEAEADSEVYRVLGYEVSTDGGVKFNHIEDSTQLVLQAGSVKGYIIRPQVAPKDNYIEIEYASGADGYVHVDNLVPQSELKDYPELRGRNILDVNPQGKTIYERIFPTVGKAYSVDVVVDTATNNGKIVRPTVSDSDNGKTYTTNKYYFLARNNKDNNRFKVGTKYSDPANVHDYTLTGSAVTKAISVRQDGKGYNILPTKGYNILTGSGQAEVTDKTTNKKVPVVNVSSSAVAEDGAFTLSGKSGESGDLITVLCTNGLSDDQIIELKLGINQDKNGKYVDNSGQLVMGYPMTAPAIKTVSYSYEKASSSQGVTLNESQIRLLDDTLKLTAVVDNKGQDIESVRFVVKDVSGATKELTAKPQDGTSNNVFEVDVKSMLNYFHTGDKIYAYVVDKASVSISYGTTTKEQKIIYPQIDTGLSTYVENEKISPKTYSQENDAKSLMNVNLPVIGGPASGTQSGLITFNKTWHEGHKSYSYTANIDTVYDNVVDSTQSKAKRTKGAANSLNEAYKQRKDKLQNRANKEAEIEQKKQDRQDAIDNGHTQNTDKDHMPVDDNVALDIFYNGDSASEISGLDLQDENVANNAADQAPDAKAKEILTEGYPRYSVNVYLCVDLEFVLNEQTNEFVLSMWSVVVGGKYTIDQVYYTFIMYMPFYLDLTGMIQINFYFGALTDNFKNAAKAGDFDNYSGNLKDMADGSTVIGGTDATFVGKFQLGAGVSNCVGVRGGISLTFQFQFAQLGAASKDWAGAVLGVSGSVGIDLLVTQFNWTFGTVQKGWGTLSHKTQVEWLAPWDNNEKSSRAEQVDPKEDDAKKDDSSKALANAAAEDTAALSLDDEPEDESESEEAANGGYYTVRPLNLGSSPDEEGEEGFSNTIEKKGWLRSALSLDTKEDLMKTLKVNAAERTKPQLIAINDERTKYLLLFIGAGKDTTTKADTSQLYYSIYNGQEWSDPKAVDGENCHYDSSPDIIEVKPNVYMAAWLDAREAIDTSSNAADFRKAYTAFDVRGAIFDFSKDYDAPEFKTLFTFSSDEKAKSSDSDADASKENTHYFNMAPQLTKCGGKIYCTYLKRDISKAESIKELTDLTKSYSLVAYVSYDYMHALDGQEISEERFFSQHWEGTATDPYITNYAAEGFTGTSADGLTESDYVAVAYTIDGDSDLETNDDRNIYLSIYNTTDKIAYYPIKLTSDTKTQTMLQMNTLNGQVYLTWIEQGMEDINDKYRTPERSDQRFSIMNISEVINELLQTKGISDEYFYPDGKKAETTTGVQTPTNYQTPSNYVASPTEYTDNKETALLSNISESSALNDKVLLSAMKASMNSLNVNYVSQGDPYNTSGWKNLENGWKVSGNDWYHLSADDMKEKLIDYLVKTHEGEQVGVDSDGNPIYYDTKYVEANYADTEYKEDDPSYYNGIKDGIYSNWVVGRALEYNLPKYTTILADYTGRSSASINEYKLVGDGENIYVFYNDFCNDITHTGQELYAMRFTDRKASEFDEDKEEWSGESAGFTEPVMLTDEDKIIDEFDIQQGPTKGSEKDSIKLVSNLYDQSTGKNNLVYFTFIKEGSIKPVASSIDIDEHIVKGSKTELHFDIENEGLYTSEGCYIRLELLDKNGKTLENIAVPSDVKSHLESIRLEPGETYNITIPWTPDRDLKDTSLRVTATEQSDSIRAASYTATVSVPYKPVIEINDYELSYEDGKIRATATVANHGNQDVSELKMVFTRMGIDLDEDEKLETKTVSGGLKSGEEKEISFVYTPKVSDFDGFERIKFELSAIGDGEELESDADSFTDEVPVICEIENGAKEINIKAGQTKQLEFKAAPYNELSKDAMFYSTDPTVAYVDEDGVLHALKNGTVTITLYYPSLGISTLAKVVVGGNKTARNSDRYKDGTGTGTISVGAGIPSSAINGNWTFHPDTGKWTFAAGNREYKNEWAFIYNPYATELESQTAWFRFDADGNMVTGWFTDADGNVYYLWPYSDHTMGHMVTGWMPIGTNWYFFNPVSNGIKGVLYRSTTTPDGYRVGADGAWIHGLVTLNQP